MIWYYIDESVTDGDRRKGPFSIDDIMEFVKAGEIKSSTLVWHSGLKDWLHWEEAQKELTPDGPQDSERTSIDPDSTPSAEEEAQVKEALEAILADYKATRRYAGFFTRGLAYIIDNFILSVIGIIIMYAMSFMQVLDANAVVDAMNAYVTDPTAENALEHILDAQGMHLFLSIWGVLQAFYFIIFTAIKSATPGKMLLHVHVETSVGDNANWMISILRYVASLFTQFTLMFYGLGYLIVFIDPKRRALHDFIARTRVVHDRKPVSVSFKEQDK